MACFKGCVVGRVAKESTSCAPWPWWDNSLSPTEGEGIFSHCVIAGPTINQLGNIGLLETHGILLTIEVKVGQNQSKSLKADDYQTKNLASIFPTMYNKAVKLISI